MITQDETRHRRLEELWDLKLRRARARYFRSLAEFHKHLLEHPGGSEGGAVQTADVRRQEAQAFAEYCRALATFTELTAGRDAPIQDRSNPSGLAPRAKIG